MSDMNRREDAARGVNPPLAASPPSNAEGEGQQGQQLQDQSVMPPTITQYLQDNSPHRMVDIGYDDEAMTPTPTPLTQQGYPDPTDVHPRPDVFKDPGPSGTAACIHCPELHGKLDESQVRNRGRAMPWHHVVTSDQSLDYAGVGR